MLSAASRDALAQLEKAGIGSVLPEKLIDIRTLAQLVSQLLPVLKRVNDEPAHSDSLQSAWRVLPGLMEDAVCLGLFDRHDTGWPEPGLLTRLRAADAACLHDPAARPVPPKLDRHLGPRMKSTLESALPYLLEIIRQDDSTIDWVTAYEAVQRRVTEPAPITGGQTQVGAGLSSGVALLKPVMRDGNSTLESTGEMAWRDPDGSFHTGDSTAMQSARAVGQPARRTGAMEAFFAGDGDDGMFEEDGPDDDAGLGSGSFAFAWGGNPPLAEDPDLSAPGVGQPGV